LAGRVKGHPLLLDGKPHVVVLDPVGRQAVLWSRRGIIAAYRPEVIVHSHRLWDDLRVYVAVALARMWRGEFDPGSTLPAVDGEIIRFTADSYVYKEPRMERYGRSEAVRIALGMGYKPREFYTVARKCHLALLPCVTWMNRGECPCVAEVEEEAELAVVWLNEKYLPAAYVAGWHGDEFVIRDEGWWTNVDRQTR
jgi:hypothetical protein